MWGNTILETVFTGNYMFGFLTTRSNNLLHLTHWQYWFWFWFTWYLGLYYIIFLNFFIKRNLKVSPKIFTSFRSHGKWGDLLVCFVPISWCLNILTNSNFILRLVEWQSESSVFSLRVRGKQWYWVYKIDILNLYNLNRVSKNIGWDSWSSLSNNNYYTLSDSLVLQDKFSKQLTYWNHQNNITDLNFLPTKSMSKNFVLSFKPGYTNTNNIQLNNTTVLNYYNSNIYNNSVSGSTFNFKNNLSGTNFILNNDTKIKWYSNYLNNTFRLNNFNLTEKTNKSFNKFLENSFLIIKQKRFNYKTFGNSIDLVNNNFAAKIPVQEYFQFLHSDFLKSYVFTKRLLRTSKILVLPTNVNISVITNSFDVIHSWFIPGLGLKLDCVPGRSTHHTLHIINPGFYYGQCAEICGRYHHHMPIRVCALTYPHFIFWWNNKGVYQFLQKKEGFLANI